MESNGKGLNHRTVTVMGRQRWSMQLCRLRISWADRRRYCPLAAFLYKRYGLPWLSGVWCNINLPSALSLRKQLSDPFVNYYITKDLLNLKDGVRWLCGAFLRYVSVGCGRGGATNTETTYLGSIH